MLSVYDLHDLYTAFVRIRFRPNYEFNSLIITKIIENLSNLNENKLNYEFNTFRKALSSIKGLDEELYNFVFVENVYTYIPSLINNENINILLSKSCECLLKAIEDGNNEQITDLADCLHNLPIYIIENNSKLPKNYWKNEVKYYRNKWDESFLLKEQNALKLN